MCRKLILLTAVLALVPLCAQAQNHLLYFEAQAVAGYSSATDKVIFYSMDQDEAMQKPSLGCDFIRRFAGEARDFGMLALQVRLACDRSEDRRIELQVYNAYFKYKTRWADVWIGHNRPALGLSSYFDSHGLLLPALPMIGYGFDRDWGLGLYRDHDWGNMSASLTTGSGMPVHFKGNYLAAARMSKGVLEKENYCLGLSLVWGEVLSIMGYELMMPDPYPFRFVSTDFSYLWRQFESRIELMTGEKMHEESYAVFWRLGMNLLDENRLKLEVQPVFRKDGSVSSSLFSAGLSFWMTADLAVRSMYQHEHFTGDDRYVIQFYYYKGV